jgi:vacuolar protein-sorting-associated protein 4
MCSSSDTINVELFSEGFLRFEKRIYIPLPGIEARKRMFELHVGTTPCELSQKDYRVLAERTEGCVCRVSLSYYPPSDILYCIFFSYSGSDIFIVVREALMEPIRKITSATHFKPVDHNGCTKWTPCSPADQDAVEKSLSEVESDELLEPPLRLRDFLTSLDNVRPTVTEGDIKRHDDWTKESGTLT